jgi:hypothetical protein
MPKCEIKERLAECSALVFLRRRERLLRSGAGLVRDLLLDEFCDGEGFLLLEGDFRPLVVQLGLRVIMSVVGGGRS